MDNIASDRISNLLIEDLKQFSESLWRNEDVGEKRFNFFLTLVTAVVAGLVALYTAKDFDVSPDSLALITNGAMAALLVLGVLTYLRLLQRNRVSDQYQRTLRYIRDRIYSVPPSFDLYEVPQPLNAGRWKYFKGGLAETVGALNSVLIGVTFVFNSWSLALAVAVSLLSLSIFWAIASRRKGVS